MSFQQFNNDHLNESQAARYLGLTVLTLRRHHEQGHITSTKIGSNRFYRKADLDRFLTIFGSEIRLRQARAAGGTRRITRAEFATMLANEAATLGGK